MATARNVNRPLSPHLQVWKWGPHMLISILHRATGSTMATVGTVLLVWWLAAIASGKDAYATFLDPFTYKAGGLNVVGYIFGIGLTLTFFIHMANGIRHWFMDTGANFELKGNKTSSIAVLTFAVLATALYWAYLIWGK